MYNFFLFLCLCIFEDQAQHGFEILLYCVQVWICFLSDFIRYNNIDIIKYQLPIYFTWVLIIFYNNITRTRNEQVPTKFYENVYLLCLKKQLMLIVNNKIRSYLHYKNVGSYYIFIKIFVVLTVSQYLYRPCRLLVTTTIGIYSNDIWKRCRLIIY